jgi:hypothetical protein
LAGVSGIARRICRYPHLDEIADTFRREYLKDPWNQANFDRDVEKETGKI